MWRKVLFGMVGAVGLAVTGLVALLTVAQLWAEGQLVRVYDVEVHAVQTSKDPGVLARGELVGRRIAMCVNCHGDDLGGSDWMEVPGLVHLYAPNISGGQGSPTADYSDSDWVGAIRHGVRPDGTGLTAMPDAAKLSADDLAALVSWLKQVPKIDRAYPQSELYVGVRVMWMLGVAELHEVNTIDHHAAPVLSPPRQASAEYGEYVAQTACHGCHGADLTGGQGPDISTAGIPDYTIEQFYGAVRGGVGGDGRVLSDEMPWRLLGGLPDTEMRALWAYVRREPAG